MLSRRYFMLGGAASLAVLPVPKANSHHSSAFKKAFKLDPEFAPQRVRYRNSYDSGTIVIDENTVVGNGVNGTETSGIRLFGSGHEVTRNIIQDNEGAGVFVVPDGVASPGAAGR